MVNRTIIGLVACALISPVARASAQLPPEPIARLKPGTTVRIDGETLGRIEGRFLRATPDSGVVVLQAAERGVPVAAITSLWERGKATKTGAIVGGVVGAAALGTLASVGCSIARSDDGKVGNEDQFADCAVLGALLGLVGGGALGTGVGALIPKWHLRYRSGQELRLGISLVF